MAQNAFKAEDVGHKSMENTARVENEEVLLDLDIPLVYDLDEASQLGTSKYYTNKTAAQQSSPRSTITAQELRNFRFKASFRKAKWGTFRDRPACLVVLDFSFQKFGSTISRYKHAEIDISFEDAAFAMLEELTEQQEEERLRYQPQILAFEPREFHGPELSETGSSQIGTQLSLNVPSAPLSLSQSYSKQTPFVRQGAAKVHGMTLDEETRLKLAIDENPMSEDGIRSEWSAAIILKYHPRRKFAARIQIRAHLYLRLLNPVCGEKDDPIFFDPDKMQIQSVSGQDQKSSQSTSTPAGTIAKLDDEDLQDLTRLKNWGGSFLKQ